jgi:hypothetical protein
MERVESRAVAPATRALSRSGLGDSVARANATQPRSCRPPSTATCAPAGSSSSCSCWCSRAKTPSVPPGRLRPPPSATGCGSSPSTCSLGRAPRTRAGSLTPCSAGPHSTRALTPRARSYRRSPTRSLARWTPRSRRGDRTAPPLERTRLALVGVGIAGEHSNPRRARWIAMPRPIPVDVPVTKARRAIGATTRVRTAAPFVWHRHCEFRRNGAASRENQPAAVMPRADAKCLRQRACRYHARVTLQGVSHQCGRLPRPTRTSHAFLQLLPRINDLVGWDVQPASSSRAGDLRARCHRLRVRVGEDVLLLSGEAREHALRRPGSAAPALRSAPLGAVGFYGVRWRMGPHR